MSSWYMDEAEGIWRVSILPAAVTLNKAGAVRAVSVAQLDERRDATTIVLSLPCDWN